MCRALRLAFCAYAVGLYLSALCVAAFAVFAPCATKCTRLRRVSLCLYTIECIVYNVVLCTQPKGGAAVESSQSFNSESIYDILEDEIVSLVIKPGQALGEVELSERFGVSRTPIRAVLRRLADRGLVEIEPYKATRVTLLSRLEIEQLIYMRVAVETAVLKDFMDVVSPILMEKIRYIIRKQAVLIEGTFESGQFYALDSQLHEVWFKETGKLHLWEMIRQAQVHYTRFRMLDILAAQMYPQIVAEHEELFALLEKKDKAALDELMQRHLYGGITRLRGRINTDFHDYFRD
ncbi:MAG: GntR family transcriptional regulator [Oscillospiraceae bacterium]|nr:GntR family transcriptional regulator [Oscillospiraceae bacterium]